MQQVSDIENLKTNDENTFKQFGNKNNNEYCQSDFETSVISDNSKIIFKNITINLKSINISSVGPGVNIEPDVVEITLDDILVESSSEEDENVEMIHTCLENSDCESVDINLTDCSDKR